MKWQWSVALAFLATLAVVGVAVAASGPFGRDYNTGYFTGTAYDGTDLIFEPFGTDPLTNNVGFGRTCEENCNLASFEAVFQARLYDPTSVIDQARAAALIDMMLGQPGTAFGTSQAGIDYAQTNFQNWKDLIAIYNSGSVPGYSVQWNKDINFGNPGFNGWTAVGATSLDKYSDLRSAGDVILQDGNGGAAVETTIDFTTNGHQFIIRQGCGCTTGDDTSLQIQVPTWSLAGSSTVTPSTATAGQSTPVTFTHTVTNQGPTTATYSEHVNYYYPDSSTLVSQLDNGTQTTNSGSSYTYSDQETIPSTAQPGQQYCESITYDDATGPLTASATTPESCVTVGVQSCTDALSGIADPWQPGISSPVTLNFPAAGSGGGTVIYTITGPNGFTQSGGPVSVASGIGSYTISSVTLPSAGTYTVTWTPSGHSSCTQSIPVAYAPYFNVLGGDVTAGAGMDVGDTCGSEDASGGFASWNQEDTPNYAGAGTQYAALALNLLQDFATGAGSGIAPSELSFSNTVNVKTGGNGAETDTYGGGLGNLPCTPDYFNPPATPTSTGNQTITTPPSGTHTWYIASNVNIDLAGRVLSDSHTTMYVDGNVYISSDIIFRNSYTALAHIPSFNVIASGNIYIDSSVSEVDGIYVAEPNASGNNGIIYTCATANGYTFSAATLDSSLDAACDNHLDVYGSFVARQIWLLRTHGTLSTSQPAETFHYTPDVWMTGGIKSSTESYNGITDLPPSL